MQFIDSTGYWTCSGGNDCEKWVQETLDMLKNSGDLGHGIYIMFLAMDETKEIEIKFTNSESCSGISPSTMRLSHHLWETDPNPGSTAIFAHEFTHMVQATDLFGNISILSEMVAYEVQYQVLHDLGETPPDYIRKIHDCLTGDVSTISNDDLKKVRKHLLNATSDSLTNWYYRITFQRPIISSVNPNPIPMYKWLGSTPAQNTIVNPGSGGSGQLKANQPLFY